MWEAVQDLVVFWVPFRVLQKWLNDPPSRVIELQGSMKYTVMGGCRVPREGPSLLVLWIWDSPE